MPNDRMTNEQVCEVAHQASIEVIYVDEGMLQLEAIVNTSQWRGGTTAYATADDISSFVAAIKRFTIGETNTARLEIGATSGIGLIAFRFYRIDRAGHVACHIRLASGEVATSHREEEIAQMSLEVGVEVWAAEQFARQLAEFPQSRSGCAVLRLIP